jgi:hypothetical protein
MVTPPVPLTEPMRRPFTLAALLLFVAAGALAGSLEEQKQEAARIRGLSFIRDVKAISIDRSDLPAHLHKQLTASLPYSFADYGRILAALRLIDRPEAASEPKLLDLLEQQVLAFYDPLTHTYFAIRQLPRAIPVEARQLPLEDAVAVHEFTHALQDQHFAIGLKDYALRNDWDASMALHAVIEGDATLVMMAKLAAVSGMTLSDLVSNDMLVSGLSSAAAMMKSDNDGTPRYFVDQLAFPYVQGLRFVIEAYRRGGWKAVDQIYADPPRSTRDVMHPEEYFAGGRTANAFTTQPPFAVQRLLTVEHLGEYHWSFLLGGDNARGWRGDRATLVDDAFCQPTVLVETRWESPQRAASFRAAYATFLDKQGIQADLVQRGNDVDVAYGADPVLAGRFMKR